MRLLRSVPLALACFTLGACLGGGSGSGGPADGGPLDAGDAARADEMPIADAAVDVDLAVDAPVDASIAAPLDGSLPDAAVDDSRLMLRTAFGGVDTLAFYVEDIFAIWWDPRFDHAADAPILAEQLIAIRRDCIDDLGMADPPNPPAGYYYNVYIHHGADDVFPEGWGNAQSTDRFGMPFLTLPDGAHRDPANIYHEGFHIFQYSATSPGFAYTGDSQWYVESSAQWYKARHLPDDDLTFSEAGAIVSNPQLALWHSFENEAPGDPTDWLFRVRQYGMHTWLHFMTAEGGVPSAVVSDGYYAGTDLSPQRYHVEHVGLDPLRRIFADWAARNTGGLDYLSPGQAANIWHGVNAVGDPDNLAPYAIEVGPAGTDGWVRPPDRLRPRPWAYNVVRIEGEAGAAYRIDVETDAVGAGGDPAFFLARWVTLRPGGAVHAAVPLDAAGAGGLDYAVEPGDTAGALLLVSVPEVFGGNQPFGYRVRVERRP